MSLRFHWRLPLKGKQSELTIGVNADSQQLGLPNIKSDLHFCRLAEEYGIESLLTAFGYYRPDPMLLATALGMATEKIKFIVAYRPGLISPTLFVQQINTLSALTNGRVSLNIIAGHSQNEQGYYGDFLKRDERYLRAGEFLEICHSLWKQDGGFDFEGNYYQVKDGQLGTPFVSDQRAFPEIYIGGGSPQAQEIAVCQGSCWLLFLDSPENLRQRIQPVLEQGIEVGLRGTIISRSTRTEAIEAAYSLIGATNKQWVEKVFFQNCDSQSMKAKFEHTKDEDDWLTPWLWKGAIPWCGRSAIALVGTPIEIAEAILEYKKIGCSQFIFSGWPDLEEMTYFGKEILPLVRKLDGDS